MHWDLALDSPLPMWWRFSPQVCPALSSQNLCANTIVTAIDLDHRSLTIRAEYQLSRIAALHSGALSPVFVPMPPLFPLNLSLTRKMVSDQRSSWVFLCVCFL